MLKRRPAGSQHDLEYILQTLLFASQWEAAEEYGGAGGLTLGPQMRLQQFYPSRFILNGG